ncbi:SRPBCC family protein [Nocardioides coralli]|uniref:SRPBCC family protein n=1 Tax=Nocardioides coralli TaxID=2872154 RepID=UPI001CA42712|nr:SRPBCC family protein [Nocardioides coralli]QZY29591.1 SRPBCC family protein [Nocardioides coralli]
MATHVAQSRTVPLPPEQVAHRVLTAPLEAVIRRRYAAIAPVRETRDGPAEWGEVGQSRRIVLTDGSTVLETLTQVDPPHAFGYDLTEVTGPMAPIAERVEGRWSFEPVGTGCRVTWAWTIHPAGRMGALATPLVGLMFRGYARRVLEDVERHLLAEHGHA